MGDDTPIGRIKKTFFGTGSETFQDAINTTAARASDVGEYDAKKKVAGEEKATADKAFAESEKKRMSFGSGARTLLTGPAGLESNSDDEEGYSLARKQLKGM